jgi:hypothetical protein
MEDKIFHIESSYVFDTGPVSEEESKEFELTDYYVAFKKNDLLHRDNGQPAIVCANGSKEWYQNNLLHRDNDLPAIVWLNGTKQWYQNGKYHRDNDLPAIIYADGSKVWYREGRFIRREDVNQQ